VNNQKINKFKMQYFIFRYKKIISNLIILIALMMPLINPGGFWASAFLGAAFVLILEQIGVSIQSFRKEKQNKYLGELIEEGDNKSTQAK
jgi:hypothetical protein